MIEPLGDQDHGFVAFVWSLGYAIQDLREKPDGLDPSAFFLTRLRLRANSLATAVDSEGLPGLTPEATVFLNKAIDFLRVSIDSQPTKGGKE